MYSIPILKFSWKFWPWNRAPLKYILWPSFLSTGSRFCILHFSNNCFSYSSLQTILILKWCKHYAHSSLWTFWFVSSVAQLTALALMYSELWESFVTIGLHRDLIRLFNMIMQEPIIRFFMRRRQKEWIELLIAYRDCLARWSISLLVVTAWAYCDENLLILNERTKVKLIWSSYFTSSFVPRIFKKVMLSRYIQGSYNERRQYCRTQK